MTDQPEFAGDILSLFAQRGAHRVDIPVIQPADPFLDMAGEELRRRIFLTESESGTSLCLRPEFTIPVCMHHIESNPTRGQRYAYLGQVFRQRRDGDSEFYQAGIEDLGDADIAHADAKAITDAYDTLSAILPKASFDTTLGDQTVFEAVIAALGLPDGWQTRLVRAFGEPEQLDLLLQALSRPPGQIPGLDAETAILLAREDETALAVAIEWRMAQTGYLAGAGRAPDEIARRLIQKARLAGAHLEPEALDVLKTLLALEVAMPDAIGALDMFAAKAGLDIGSALAIFERRVEALRASGFDLAAMHYRAAFGRPLDYYTGLVFEMSSSGSVLAGGGRFDRLLTLLGAQTTTPAVGFSLWLDRIAAVRGIGDGGRSKCV
ncbi:MAG: ATP phosphoribosyltransferase regulatory subunit [Pseudomonadota bacterium]